MQKEFTTDNDGKKVPVSNRKDDGPHQEQTTPPRQTSTPATPDTSSTALPITPESIVTLARTILPQGTELVYFNNWRKNELPELVTKVIAATITENQGYPFFDDTESAIGQFNTSIKAIYDNLNAKNVIASGKNQPCPDLPGACNDATCQSLFDTNELAIRGRKAVSTKRFYFPIILPEFRLAPNQMWGLGQKVEFEQEWRHEGFTLGNLISSFSLLPNEETTIEVSDWQRTKSEIQQETDLETKQGLEDELKRTDEETISNEAAKDNGWSLSATASVSYGPVSASASASATGNTSDRLNQAQKHVQESTRKATSEVSSKRSVKINQSNESFSEHKVIRKMKNPNQCHTVTFNFFQVIKLMNVQMRFVNDAPVLYYPGLFPEFYTNKQRVQIPYEAIESFNAAALFLTQFFDVDRDLSQEIHGFALRVRMDIGKDTEKALRALIESLLVATKYILRLNPNDHITEIAHYVKNYIDTAVQNRTHALENYGFTTAGVAKGESHQINTAGVYVDSLLGRCSACEDEIQSERYVAIKKQEAESKQIEATTKLLESENERRKLLIKNSILNPFNLDISDTPPK